MRPCRCWYKVTLFERRPYLGGRASSYEHPGTGEVVDNCQHMLLGCCTNLIDFYNASGSSKRSAGTTGSRSSNREDVQAGWRRLVYPRHCMLSRHFLSVENARHERQAGHRARHARDEPGLPEDQMKTFLLAQQQRTDETGDRTFLVAGSGQRTQ